MNGPCAALFYRLNSRRPQFSGLFFQSFHVCVFFAQAIPLAVWFFVIRVLSPDRSFSFDSHGSQKITTSRCRDF